MKEPLHIRVFKLKRGRYKLPFGGMSLEEYVLEELHNGYIITDMKNYTIEKLQVTTYHSPARAKQYLDAGSMVSNLAEAPAEEV